MCVCVCARAMSKKYCQQTHYTSIHEQSVHHCVGLHCLCKLVSRELYSPSKSSFLYSCISNSYTCTVYAYLAEQFTET